MNIWQIPSCQVVREEEARTAAATEEEYKRMFSENRWVENPIMTETTQVPGGYLCREIYNAMVVWRPFFWWGGTEKQIMSFFVL
jgi:hypothetical protein